MTCSVMAHCRGVWPVKCTGLHVNTISMLIDGGSFLARCWAYYRNPSRRYIESLEARVASLETVVNSVRDVDTNALPSIIREIRSGSEDIQYYAPLNGNSADGRKGSITGFADDTTGSPLVELGKIMGTLQLEDGQVGGSRSWLTIRCDTLDPRRICL